VNAKEGLDEDAAHHRGTGHSDANAARNETCSHWFPPGLPSEIRRFFQAELRLRLVAYFIKRIVKNLTYFISEAVTWPPSVMTGKKVICCPTGH
jgi:hypothetical protein